MKELTEEQKAYIVKQMIVILDSKVCSNDSVTLENYKKYSKKDYDGVYSNLDEYDLIISIIDMLNEG